MGPTCYSLGPMLCSSSDISRIVGNEIRPKDNSYRILPLSHKFLSRTCKELSAKRALMGLNNYTSGLMLCSSSAVLRVVGSVFSHHYCSNCNGLN